MNVEDKEFTPEFANKKVIEIVGKIYGVLNSELSFMPSSPSNDRARYLLLSRVVSKMFCDHYVMSVNAAMEKEKELRKETK